MTSDEIADYVVAAFKELENPPIEFQAVNPEIVSESYAESATWKASVIPTNESETPFDSGDACERLRVVSVVVCGPVKGAVNRAKGLALVEFLRLSFEETRYGRYIWAGNSTKVLWDQEALKDRGQFLSVFEATYRDFN